MRQTKPPRSLLSAIARQREAWDNGKIDSKLSQAYRELLIRYGALRADGVDPDGDWTAPVSEALRFLGGQPDRTTVALARYDHRRFGPFLGVSNEGGGADIIAEAALSGPKAQALGKAREPLRIGVAVDAERLSSIGEVPAGPDDFAAIWRACTERILTTTNVGSRVNLRIYKPSQLLTVGAGDLAQELAAMTAALDAAIKPFVEAPGGPRPLAVPFRLGGQASINPAELAKGLRVHIDATYGENAKLYSLVLHVDAASGAAGVQAVSEAIDLATKSEITTLQVTGQVTGESDLAISLPGLRAYFSSDELATLLAKAKVAGVILATASQLDLDAIAHQVWSALNTARAMGLNMGKYGLVPLTLEQADSVVGKVQRWFSDWTSAPVCYLDQGIIAGDDIFAGPTLVNGVERWLRMVASHGVKLVLIDTVDKAKGWKLLKVDDDPKGLLTLDQLVALEALGQKLGVNTLWAGGISVEQAELLGRCGVFGIYVTSSVSVPAPVTGPYVDDPALAAAKAPTRDGIHGLITHMDAGFLAARLGELADPKSKAHVAKIENAAGDREHLMHLLPAAWRHWWKSLAPKPAKRKV